MTPKEYRKTWYYKIQYRGTTPDNWVSATPIKIFGWATGFFLIKCAKPNYPWNPPRTKDSPKPIVKFSPPKKKLCKCPQNGKSSMVEMDAKQRAKKLGIRAYRCEFCPHWHLTHKKDKLKMH